MFRLVAKLPVVLTLLVVCVSVTVPGTAVAVVRLMLTPDRAYIGVPMGMTELRAGRLQYFASNYTTFYENDINVDGIEFRIMPTDMATIGLWYFIDYEARENGDLVDDNDNSRYGAYVDVKFAGDWGTRASILYRDDQVITDGRDDDGAYGVIDFAGPAGPVAVSGAFAFDDQGEGDTGYGGFLKGGMQFWRHRRSPDGWFHRQTIRH